MFDMQTYIFSNFYIFTPKQMQESNNNNKHLNIDMATVAKAISDFSGENGEDIEQGWANYGPYEVL
jgi:hypothetical protein